MFIYYILVVVFLLLGYIFLDQKRKYETFWKHIYVLPGPDYNPIIGNTGGLCMNQVETFKFVCNNIVQNQPICRMWSVNYSLITLSDPRDIEIVLSSMKHISKGTFYDYFKEWLGSGLLTSTGSKWQQRRKILTPAFHFTILQDFVKIFNKETDVLVKKLKRNSDQPFIDVMEPVTEFTLNSIGETSLGVDMNLQPNRNEYKEAIFTFGYGLVYIIMRPWLFFPLLFNLSSFSKEYRKALEVLHGFSNKIIYDRKKLLEKIGDASSDEKRKTALLDLLLLAKKNRTVDIDDVGIREEVDTFMFEAHDTTATGFSFLLLALANEPKWQEAVRQEIYAVLGDGDERPTYYQLNEMKLMERCIKESLRLYPSVAGISRITDEDITTSSGHYIPKGAGILIHFFTLHRSSELWDNPEKFDPDRFLPENSAKRHAFCYLPFSAGPRNCIGQRFAMLEMKAGLCGILRNFNLEPVDKPEDIVFKADIILRPDGELKVKFVSRGHD